MKKIRQFLYRNHDKGIKNLMFLIVLCNAVFLVIGQVPTGLVIINKMTFSVPHILAGEVWRIFTFIMVPEDFSLFFGVISLYFYYLIGSTLEREWGVLKFNLYYLTGMLGTILYCFFLGARANASFINLSMFFAFATLYPEFKILLFFIIPVKMKYLAIFNALFFLLSIGANPFPENLIPLVALLNYFLYFGGDIVRFMKNHSKIRKRSAEYRSNIVRINHERVEKQYRHKCVVCGKTDVSHPNMEFRYCSRCAGTPCYCETHIFSHEHIRDLE